MGSQGAVMLWVLALLATIMTNAVAWLRCVRGAVPRRHVRGTLAPLLPPFRHPAGAPHLPDLVHELIPQVKSVWVPGLGTMDAVEAIDVSLVGLIAATLLLTATRRAPWLVLRRTLVVHASVISLRCLTVLCTSLPDSRPKCHAATGPSEALGRLSLRRVLATALMNTAQNITCGDLVFSGHTALAVLMAMVWHSYYKVRAGTFAVNWVKVVIWVWALATVALIITARLHYTLDVLLGLYLCVTMWGSYHRVADDVLLKHRFYSGAFRVSRGTPRHACAAPVPCRSVDRGRTAAVPRGGVAGSACAGGGALCHD